MAGNEPMCGITGFLQVLRGESIIFLTLSGSDNRLAGITMPFSVIKLIILIGWVYLCLYTLQYFELSPIVPRRYKPFVNIVGLFFGPIIFLLLLITDSIFNYSGIQVGIIGKVKGFSQLVSSGLKSIDKPFAAKHSRGIILLHSSGKDIEEVYGGSAAIAKHDRNILRLTEEVVYKALAEQASDILIDPKDDSTYTVRLRVDGILRTEKSLDFNECQAVINSIKAVSGMDISERRRPQDGAFTANTGERSFSFRVASAGVIHGEKLSIRVLNYNAANFKLDDVGLTDEQIQIVKKYLSKPNGMILLCGPTGCGKTTTLYAMLNEIDLYSRNVITVEDPIECILPQASQIEINPRADINFANSLRSILRQDPDVICVGEIRDEETASIALRASQTGHLVLATIHSHSNASALMRLIDLNVSPMLIASGLNLLVSQRLVRKLCEQCKEPAAPSQIEALHKRGIDCRNLYKAIGCDYCSSTGYKGRTAICDIVVIDSVLRNNIANNKLPVGEMRTKGDHIGSSMLKKEGLKKVISGITSLEELHRIIG